MADVMVATALGAFPDPAAEYTSDQQQATAEEEQYDYQEETAEQGEGGEYFEEEQEYTEETETQEYIETEGAAEEQYEGGDETFGEETAAEGEFVEEQTDMDGGELEAEQEGGAEEANGETWEGDEVQGGEDQQQPEEGETGDAEENGETEYAEDPAPADARRIQLVITVEIEEGRADRIEMREGDSPRALAVQFCTEHGLEDSVIEPLTEHILDNIAQLRARGGVSETVEETTEETTVEYQEATEEEQTVTEQIKTVTESVSQRSVGSTGRTQRPPNERLTRPTKASAAKGKGAQETEKPPRPISAPSYESSERTVYSRLFEDCERQHQKLEEEKRKLEQAKQEAIGRQKVKISKKSEAMMRGRTAKEYENYGELLYVEGKIQAEQRRKLAEQKRAEEAQKEVIGLTLRPEISHLAKSMKRADDVPWNRLAAAPINKQKKLAELKIQLEEAKLAECTFAPTLNRKTRALMAERAEVLRVHHISHYDQLHQDAQRRKQRHAQYANWYPEDVTFQPNRVTKSRSKSEADSDEEVDADLFDRLYRSAQQIQAKRDKLKAELQKPVDAATGRTLFKPQIGRPPSFKRRKNVGEYLYSIRHEFGDKKEFMAEREREAAEEAANKKYVNKASLDLLDRMRGRRFQQIFKYLDKDKDGTVDLASSDLEPLDVEVKEDIQEATRLAGEEPVVTFDKFTELMTAVLNGRKTGPRKYLLPDSHRSGGSNRDMTFAYKMGKKSREMAERRRRSDLTPEQWYQMQLVERARIAERIEKLKQEKLAHEMAECTFRPGINATASESRLKALLARPKTDKTRTAEERIASLERELRDVHGFILGTNAPGKDAPAWSPESEPLSFSKGLAATTSQATNKSRNTSVTSAGKQQRSSVTSSKQQDDATRNPPESESEEESDSEDEREKARDMRSRIQAMGARQKTEEEELPEVLRAVKRTVTEAPRVSVREESEEDEETDDDDDVSEEDDDEEKEEEAAPVRQSVVRTSVTKSSYVSRGNRAESDDSDSDSDESDNEA